MDVYRLVFGLSANPVHIGHTEMVRQAYTHLDERGYALAGALLVPVYRRNPVGAAKERLPETFEDRCAMCRLAARYLCDRLALPVGQIAVSAIEAELAAGHRRPNYTAETLDVLKARFGLDGNLSKGGLPEADLPEADLPEAGLIFLISSELVSGADPQFGHWYRVDKILALAALAICPRPGYVMNDAFVRDLARRGGDVIVLPEVETPDVSATELRERLHAGESPQTLARQGLLIPSVAHYLARHPIYGPGTPVDLPADRHPG